MGTFNISSAAVSSIICDQGLSFSSGSGSGVYYIDIELGTGIGEVFLRYNAASIPDRFQIEWNGSIVADSKHVGDFLTGNPPDADTALWEGGGGSGQFVGQVYNAVPDLVWNGTAFVASGPTTNFTVLQSDVADFGSEDGQGILSFTKSLATPSTMTVIITSLPDNTGWDFTVGCPSALTGFLVSTLTGDACLAPNLEPYDLMLYHDGAGAVPAIGDTVYSDSLGVNPFVTVSNNQVQDTSYLETDGSGVRQNITCL